MKTIEESVVTAMDGDNKDLFEYLPYILQDIWEIGSEPETIIGFIEKYTTGDRALKVLDLGCGKGAVSVRVAKKLGCFCHGIDAIPQFIDFADQKAVEYGVDGLCKFEVADIRQAVAELKGFDVIILGAIGPVFGNFFETLTCIKPCLSAKGIIIIDEAYIDDESDFSHPLILKKAEMLSQIDAAGMQVTEIQQSTYDEYVEADDIIISNLEKRCHELMQKNPDKRKLFEDYIKKQHVESDVNASKAVCASMLITTKL